MAFILSRPQNVNVATKLCLSFWLPLIVIIVAVFLIILCCVERSSRLCMLVNVFEYKIRMTITNLRMFLFICLVVHQVLTTSANRSDVIMGAMASEITSLTIIYSTFYSGGDQIKKTSKLRVTGLCGGNSPVVEEFPAQMASNAKNVSIWWRHNESRW